MEPIRERQLGNGLRIAIFDKTNRYFGDYHRVCLQIVMIYDLASAAAGVDDPFWTESFGKFGPEFRLEQRLERMGVAGDKVEATVAAMADDFLATADQYLARSDYPRQLIRSEMDKRSKFLGILK